MRDAIDASKKAMCILDFSDRTINVVPCLKTTKHNIFISVNGRIFMFDRDGSEFETFYDFPVPGEHDVTRLETTKDERFLISISGNSRVCFHEIASGRLFAHIFSPNMFCDMAVNDTYLFLMTQGKIHICEIARIIRPVVTISETDVSTVTTQTLEVGECDRLTFVDGLDVLMVRYSEEDRRLRFFRVDKGGIIEYRYAETILSQRIPPSCKYPIASRDNEFFTYNMNAVASFKILYTRGNPIETLRVREMPTSLRSATFFVLRCVSRDGKRLFTSELRLFASEKSDVKRNTLYTRENPEPIGFIDQLEIYNASFIQDDTKLVVMNDSAAFIVDLAPFIVKYSPSSGIALFVDGTFKDVAGSLTAKSISTIFPDGKTVFIKTPKHTNVSDAMDVDEPSSSSSSSSSSQGYDYITFSARDRLEAQEWKEAISFVVQELNLPPKLRTKRGPEMLARHRFNFLVSLNHQEHYQRMENKNYVPKEVFELIAGYTFEESK